MAQHMPTSSGKMGRFRYCHQIPLALLFLCAAAAPVFAADQKQPTTRFSYSEFPLARMPKSEAAELAPSDVPKAFPAFQHEPFESSGFNAMSLPFRYVEAGADGNADEANAFAFLLSNALDWAPGNYSARHAYFVFKRSAPVLEPFRTEYNRRHIGLLIRDWNATHAIGGELVHKEGGYSGTLEIYNHQGRTAHRVFYEEPRGYFVLLGDMAADAMRFLDRAEPSAALIRHMKQPRCKRFESIAMLGSTAFMEERSDAEFALYTRILQQDPDFAEVRSWWANQKYWRDGDAVSSARNVGASLKSYLTATALGVFDVKDADDAEFTALYPQWVQRIGELTGEDTPLMMREGLTHTYHLGTVNLQLLARATRVAERYPNSYHLMRLLANQYAQPAGPTDLDMATSISFAAASCRHMPGMGDRIPALLDYAGWVNDLGRPDIALLVAQASIPPTPVLQQFRVGVRINAGQFSEAVDEYHNWSGRGSSALTPAACYAATAAALSGRKDAFNDICRRHASELSHHILSPVFNAYADLLNGQDTELFPSFPKGLRGDWRGLQWALALAQIDLIHGREAYRAAFSEMVQCFPNSHLAWVILDAYERRTPSVEGQHFYAALAWMYGDDSWVRTTAAANALALSPPRIDVEPLFEQLKDQKAERWPSPTHPQLRGMPAKGAPSPWTIAAAVHQLMEKEPRRAQELAYRYYAYTMDLTPSGPRIFANHLIHTMEQSAPAVARSEPSSIVIKPSRKAKAITSVKEPGEQ